MKKIELKMSYYDLKLDKEFAEKVVKVAKNKWSYLKSKPDSKAIKKVLEYFIDSKSEEAQNSEIHQEPENAIQI